MYQDLPVLPVVQVPGTIADPRGYMVNPQGLPYILLADRQKT